MMEEVVPIDNRSRSDSNGRRRWNRSNDDRSYLSESLQRMPYLRAKYSMGFNEEQKRELALNELALVGQEVDSKITEAQCKANSYKLIGTIISVIILLCSAVIIGLEAVSTCVNIPVIVLSGIIFVGQGADKLFKWGPQGVLYKSATIQLKRISRDVRECLYEIHKYTVEQLLSVINHLRMRYDDIDMGLYKMSMNGTAKYNSGGFEVEDGPGLPMTIPVNTATNNSNPALNPNTAHNPEPGSGNPSPHVHIHIDGMTPLPNPTDNNTCNNNNDRDVNKVRQNSAPTLTVNNNNNHNNKRSVMIPIPANESESDSPPVINDSG
jgi:hypothetical protein